MPNRCQMAMNCAGLVGASSRAATQCTASGAAAHALVADRDEPAGLGRNPRHAKPMGAPLIMEAASKVDKCLARLQSLQGTVTVPTARSVSASWASMASMSGSLSPNFGRSKSCLHGSPKVKERDKIRIHDVLRWPSDGFSGKINQERHDKYMKRLARSRTEVYDDKKNPLDPHGEWKHWSSPAGDVHKVVSEILMASQMAKQITGMMSAALVHSDVSTSDDGRRRRESSGHHRRRTKGTATISPNPMTSVSSRRARRTKREDPMHKFRVVVAFDGPAKRSSSSSTISINAVSGRKEVLYPHSSTKQSSARDDHRPLECADENRQVASSTAKKMQSRRSPRASAGSLEKPRSAVWEAKEITNRTMPAAPAATLATPATQRVPFSKLGGEADENQTQTPSSATKRVPRKKIVPGGENQPMMVPSTTTRRVPSNKVVPANENQPPSATNQISSCPTPRHLLEGPSKTGAVGSEAAAPASRPCFAVKQASRGPLLRRPAADMSLDRPVQASDASDAGAAGVRAGSATPMKPTKSSRRAMSADDTSTGSLRTEESSTVMTHVPDPPAAAPQILHVTPESSEISPAAEERNCDASHARHPPNSVSSSPALERHHRKHPSYGSSPRQQLHPQPQYYGSPADLRNGARACALTGSLRHKFALEATEIKPPTKPWNLHQPKSADKAVLFSNLAFAPASPPGSRPGGGKAPSWSSASTPTSPNHRRSSSAPRRVLDKIGRALSPGKRRSLSPEISRVLSSARQKLISLSPGKSLPLLVSRLPSKGRRSFSAPRATVAETRKPQVPSAGNLPLPPGLKAQQQKTYWAAQEIARRTGNPSSTPGVAESTKPTVRNLNIRPKGTIFVAPKSNFPADMPSKFKWDSEIPHKSRGASPHVARKPTWTSHIPAKLNGRIDDATVLQRTTTPAAPTLKPRTSTAVAPQPERFGIRHSTQERSEGGTLHGGHLRRSTVNRLSEADLERQGGVVGVLSACRRWVEESEPPLPGGAGLSRDVRTPASSRGLAPKLENSVLNGWDQDPGVIGFLSSCRRKVGEPVQPAVTDCGVPGSFKRSWSAGGRSFSTGRIRQGSGELLKKAKDWLRTQTPYRGRPQRPAAMH